MQFPQEISAKSYFVFLFSLVLLADLLIILDVPLLRPIFAFIIFNIIPGILIINILKLDFNEGFTKFVLAVGISVSFIMLAGLVLNGALLKVGFLNPLSTLSLALSFSVILAFLCIIGYNKNKNRNFIILRKHRLMLNMYYFLIIIPLSFPILSIFGVQLMNATGNNTILIIFILLIPSYITFLVYLRDRTPMITYPIAIILISASLLLMHGLTSNYLNGRDIQFEFYSFRTVDNYQYWGMANYQTVLTACLSVSLLPAIYKSLLGINNLYVFKLAYQLLFSLTPLICYVIYKKFMSEFYAFLASLFFIFQINYLFELQSALRQEAALLFFALSMLILFDDGLGSLPKRILFIIFTVSLVLSHYSTSYTFLILILSIYVANRLFSKYFYSTNVTLKDDISIIMAILTFVIIFLWYSQITVLPFKIGTNFIMSSFDSLSNVFIEEARGSAPVRILGMNAPSLPDRISTIIHDIGFIFISIGIINILISNRYRFNKNYILASSISFMLLLALLIVPFWSRGFGAGRLYQILLVLLAPLFIIGGNIILKYICPRRTLLLITFILILQFFCATYLLHQILGIPYSMDINREGIMYEELYIYDSEIIASKWLNKYNNIEWEIFSDYGGYSRLLMGAEVGKVPLYNLNLFEENKSLNNNYIYLRHLNVIKNKVETLGHIVIPMDNYYYLFGSNNEVYNNGNAIIYN